VVEKVEAALNFDQHQVERTAANFKEFIESRVFGKDQDQHFP
jgi:hypothetical protein